LKAFSWVERSQKISVMRASGLNLVPPNIKAGSGGLMEYMRFEVFRAVNICMVDFWFKTP
jgi:hypothetical protein